MGGALRAVSSERGRDPRRFAMIVFGGSGPVHAAGLAASLGIGRVLVPPSPGVFSAFGLLFAEVEHHFVQTLNRPLAAIDVGRVNALLERIGGECRALLAREGFAGARQRMLTQIDAKVRGPDLGADRRPAGRALQHRGAAGHRVGLHERAPAHLRVQRRGAGASREPAGDRTRRRAPGPHGARPRPRRPADCGSGAPGARPPRLLRPRARLAFHAGGRPSRPAPGRQRPAR